MIKWHLETRKIKELKPHPKNPRQITKDQDRNLKASLDKFGMAEVVVINTDNTIIGGHQRVRILKSQKQNEVECRVPERTLDEKEVDELNIRLNKNTAEWDYDVLADQWDLPDLIDYGFTPSELELGDFEEVDEKEEKPKKNKSCPHCGQEL